MWHQGNGQLALSIKKTNESSFQPPKRPQAPRTPFNYISEDVEYSNADNSMRYGATFTIPGSGGVIFQDKKYLAVLLITGTGKQDRDENIFDHKPFAVIADFLTKRGYCSFTRR